MARKFNIGDKVKVVKSSSEGTSPFEFGFRKGTVGRIDGYVGGIEYPYVVKSHRLGCMCGFKPRELILIERKK